MVANANKACDYSILASQCFTFDLFSFYLVGYYCFVSFFFFFNFTLIKCGPLCKKFGDPCCTLICGPDLLKPPSLLFLFLDAFLSLSQKLPLVLLILLLLQLLSPNQLRPLLIGQL